MKYINNTDYEYIMKKYHDRSKKTESFDSVHRGAQIFNRFIRNDDIFDEVTGMCGEEILSGIAEQDRQLEKEPHPIRKAKAFEYVLKNTRISCDRRDIFPAINMIDRPLNTVLINKWKAEVFNNLIPETEKKRAWFEDSGIVTIWPDYDHSVPVWERVFELGFSGLFSVEFLIKKGVSYFLEINMRNDGVNYLYTVTLSRLKQ